MASRPHTTYKKRQKELARMEKQRDKAAKRLQRKLEKNSPQSPDADGAIEGLDGEPVDAIEGAEDRAADTGNPAEDPTP
jgi:soluble cytochrome b562